MILRIFRKSQRIRISKSEGIRNISILITRSFLNIITRILYLPKQRPKNNKSKHLIHGRVDNPALVHQTPFWLSFRYNNKKIKISKISYFIVYFDKISM